MLTPGIPPQVLMGDIRNGSYDLKLICQAPNAIWGEVQSDLKRAFDSSRTGARPRHGAARSDRVHGVGQHRLKGAILADTHMKFG